MRFLLYGCECVDVLGKIIGLKGGGGVGGGIASSITPCSARATESSLQNKEVSLGFTRKLKPIYLK